MTYEQFCAELDELKITKQEFSDITGVHYKSVTNWKAATYVASWVESWLENKRKAQALDQLKNLMKTAGLCEY